MGAAVGECQIHGAGFFGVGEIHRRESSVGGELLGDFDRGRETGVGHRSHEHLTADAVHSGVDHRHLAWTVAEDRNCPRHIGIQHRAVEDGVVVGLRDGRQCAHPGDARGDLGIGRWDDLAAVTEIDLVAVVIGRVVRRGDHDAGVAAEFADRKRQYRGGQGGGQHHGGDAGAGHDSGGVAGEDVGVASRVVPDHDRGSAVRNEIRRESRGRAGHHNAVHSVATRAQAAAQSGGAELQSAVERVGEFVDGIGIARFCARDQSLEFRGRRRVGVLGQPGARSVDQCHASVMMAIEDEAPIRSAPACSTFSASR